MQEYHCSDCKHPDNDIDPKTDEVIGPVHMTVQTAKALLLSERAGTLPRNFVGRTDGLAEFCLLCNKICDGEYEYEPDYLVAMR